MDLQATRLKPVWIISLLFSLSSLGYPDDNQVALEFRLFGDTDVTIAPGESIPIILSAILKGSGELTLRVRDEPNFVTDLRENVSCDFDCEIRRQVTVSPGVNDCGKYKFRIEATFTSKGEVLRKSHTVVVRVVPKILVEPPFTGENHNEISWIPCTAHNHELFFSPNTVTLSKGLSDLVVQNAVELESQVVENLSHAVRYDYWVEATLTDGTTSLTSDKVFSTQDNTPPPRVAISDFTVDEMADVTINWPVQDDDVSFIERYQISRRQLRPEESDFAQVADVSFFPVVDFSPQNYYPVKAQNGGLIYVDGDATILRVPGELDWSALVRTSMDDRWNMEEEFLTFELRAESYVYVAIDRDISPEPNWLDERFTKNFAEPDLKLETTAGKYRVFRSREPLPPGPQTLGGNFAEGAGINHSEPNMYLVFVKPVGETLPYASEGLVSFTDALGQSSDLNTFQYRVDAVDAAGNVADGVISSPIIIDVSGKCRPEPEKWSVFSNADGEHFGLDLTNTICIQDPAGDAECESFRASDSLRFQAVRDSLKFFSSHFPEDEDTRFFDSGWLPVDSLCYTFDFTVGGKDVDFINNHRFYYRVRAKDVHGNLSTWSDTVSAIQDAFPPDDISNLACEVEIAPSCTTGAINVTWAQANDAGSGVHSYQVFRQINEGAFEKIGEVAAPGTMFSDSLHNFDRSVRVTYKVGSMDNLEHVRGVEDSRSEVSKRAPVGPSVSLHPEDEVPLCPGFSGTTKDTVRIRLDADNTDVLKYRVIVEGPLSVQEFVVRNVSLDTIPVPLNQGDGTYGITVRAEYANVTSTCSDTVRITKAQGAPRPVENLAAVQDSEPTGNIVLEWTYPDISLVSKFNVFVWPEGQSMPATPDTVITDILAQNELVIRGLVAYECDSFKVQVEDCFGNISENDPIVVQYSNRPPTIRCDSAEARPDSIVIQWDRPDSSHPKASDFVTVVEVFQDSVDGEPFKVETVRNNKQTYICFNPEPMHTYFFRVKEVITNDLMQSCADEFMSTFSLPCAVPFDNPVTSVTPLEAQPQPVPSDSVTGCVFLSWRDYVEKPTVNVEFFEVKCWSVGSTDTIRVELTGRDTLICGLDPERRSQCTVTAIDDFGRRSVMNDTVDIEFKPRWVFTPNDVRVDACFRDSVAVAWNWVDMNRTPVFDTTFGADSVQLQVSINKMFRLDVTTTAWLETAPTAHTFFREPDYPFVSRQNDTLYARIRAKDKFGNISPWSTEFFELRFGRFDDLPPPIVECRIDSVRAPNRGVANSVDVGLSWDPVADNCSSTLLYRVVIDERDTVEVEKTFYLDRDVPADTLLLRRWKVHAIDGLGNLQEFADACSVTISLEPPTESAFEGDRTICWNEGQANIPSDGFQYIIEISSNPRFLRGSDVLSETSRPPVDTLCYQYQGPWNPDSLFWRVKTLLDDFESPWSEIFDNLSISDSQLLISSVQEDDLVPTRFQLYQNYPNPFNPSTTISYDVPATITLHSHVRLDVFNILGQRIRTLVDEEKSPGHYILVWDGRDDMGVLSGSGVYYYRMSAHDVVMTRKLMFLK